MNNDLEQFSEERLKELESLGLNARLDLKPSEGISLIRITLSAKQAKPFKYFIHVMDDGVLIMKSIPDDSPLVKIAMPLYTTPQPAHTEQDDTRRMNWLCAHCVEVRDPQMYGSHAMFHAQQDSEEWDLPHHTTLREQIDKAMLAAAPKPECER